MKNRVAKTIFIILPIVLLLFATTRYRPNVVPSISANGVKLRAYYINLSSRHDRRVKIEGELKLLRVPVTRVEAVDVRSNNTELADCRGDGSMGERNMKTCAGKIGCRLSHLKALKLAMLEKADLIAVFEDDFEWSTQIDPTTVAQALLHFEKKIPKWDVVGLSMHVREYSLIDPEQNVVLGPQTDAKVVKVHDALKTHAYVVRYAYLPRLIANFEACDVKSHYEGAIDRCWTSLQEADEWYGFSSQLGFQTPGFSDIEREFKNYTFHSRPPVLPWAFENGCSWNEDCGWGKEEINMLKEEEGGMLHFDALILGGCKFYCLRKEGCVDITKGKGYKKSKGEELSFEDFETLAVGGEKTQKQVQFLCPKMNHLSVDEKFSMRTPKVTKKFRFLYNKGVVHGDGTITSFYN